MNNDSALVPKLILLGFLVILGAFFVFYYIMAMIVATVTHGSFTDQIFYAVMGLLSLVLANVLVVGSVRQEKSLSKSNKQ